MLRLMTNKTAVSLYLIIATLTIFWRVADNDFINFDDPGYVYNNPRVKTGVTLENIRWAFTTSSMGNWHPITWLSHMTDCSLFGLDPRGHHLTSLFFHIINTLLLFLLLCRSSGAQWKSAFVAALFALHPLHVESVAWVSERKDVLSALFWLLTMLAYLWYAKMPCWRRYLLVLTGFVMGLMAKPMLVTLPIVLLLFDYWPLKRMQFGEPVATLRLALEKAPLLVFAALSSFITLYINQKVGALQSLDSVPLQLRLANTLLAWGRYIEKMFWPDKLAIPYILDRNLPAGGAVVAGIFLLSVTLLAVKARKSHPYLLTGWLWYLVTLVPVIGIVQVSLQSMADRYTYIPLIGLFIIAAWGIPDLMGKWGTSRFFLTVAAFSVLITLAALTWKRVGDWKDTITLFTQATQVTTDNFVAHNNLGTALVQKGRSSEAIIHFQTALAINPNYPHMHLNLADQLLKMNRIEEAIAHYRMAVRLKPDYPDARHKLELALSLQK